MASGKVKWFDVRKGFGFIVHDNGSDVFVHYSNIQGDGFRTLKEGETVDYELIESDKGYRAAKVQRRVAPAHIPFAAPTALPSEHARAA